MLPWGVIKKAKEVSSSRYKESLYTCRTMTISSDLCALTPATSLAKGPLGSQLSEFCWCLVPAREMLQRSVLLSEQSNIVLT